MKAIFIALGLGVFVLFAIALEVPRFAKITPEVPAATYVTAQVGSTSVVAEVADTPAKRQRGLSGRSGLPPGTGMLFVFDSDGEWGIWMKHMRFSIDILWISEEGRIVTIAREVSPETYPNAFLPSSPVRYVLEVPAGFADTHGIEEGALVEF